MVTVIMMNANVGAPGKLHGRDANPWNTDRVTALQILDRIGQFQFFGDGDAVVANERRSLGGRRDTDIQREVAAIAATR
jgi:hypothetical protein